MKEGRCVAEGRGGNTRPGEGGKRQTECELFLSDSVGHGSLARGRVSVMVDSGSCTSLHRRGVGRVSYRNRALVVPDGSLQSLPVAFLLYGYAFLVLVTYGFHVTSSANIVKVTTVVSALPRQHKVIYRMVASKHVMTQESAMSGVSQHLSEELGDT
ncbi:hypothetical protein J6590_062550 [Homalodisca vitripennis]|nr:hypothetical protein J6590_062550 [Homalodisca vitripennis]